MQLAAVRKEEVIEVARFVEPHFARRLQTFEGTIIHLGDVIAGAGFRRMDTGMFGTRDIVPNLAVSRPDMKVCVFNFEKDEMVFDAQQASPLRLRHKEVRGGVQDGNAHLYRVGLPPLPAEARKAVEQNGGVDQTRILFEAKDWEQMRAPVRPAMEDPAVIRHLVGDLWGVLFTWDLTPAERKALLRAGVAF